MRKNNRVLTDDEYSNLFGKNGLISSQFKLIGSIAESEKKKFASDLNTTKNELQDLINLRDCDANLNGAISGRALYDGTIDLSTALEILNA